MATLESRIADLITEVGGDVGMILGVLSATTGVTYYPIYPPGTTPASGDPDGLVVQTA